MNLELQTNIHKCVMSYRMMASIGVCIFTEVVVLLLWYIVLCSYCTRLNSHMNNVVTSRNTLPCSQQGPAKDIYDGLKLCNSPSGARVIIGDVLSNIVCDIINHTLCDCWDREMRDTQYMNSSAQHRSGEASKAFTRFKMSQ